MRRMPGRAEQAELCRSVCQVTGDVMEEVVDFIDVDTDQMAVFWRRRGVGQGEWPELPGEQQPEEPGGPAADHPFAEANQQDGAVGEYLSELEV